jgi:hypothetical protein
MQTPEVRFEVPFPSEQRMIVSALIHQNMWLLPSWVEVIWVRFETPPQPSISARCAVNEEYRSIRFSICPEWLLSEPHIRESDVRHEFLHASTDPLHRVGRQLVAMIEDDKLRQWANEELRLAIERCTTDLEYAISRGISDR